MLEAANLVVVREGGRRALDGVSVRIRPGETVAVEGPSGGGKSTLLWALARLLPVTEGRLRLEGRLPEDVPVREWRRRVSLVPQKTVLVPGSVGANLRLPWTLDVRRGEGGQEEPPGDGVLRSELDGLGLRDVELTRDASELSVGEAARVALLRTLLARPSFVLLDEPGAALDAETAVALDRRVGAFVREGGAVLLVRHHRTEAPVDRTLRLANGRPSEGVA